ncbi:MAG: GNAT family N-acetyltransferase [Rhodobacterales bacterium]|nr:MAG: GNAT family N-acetyltransferase [Rhodobacterales bacterium]
MKFAENCPDLARSPLPLQQTDLFLQASSGRRISVIDGGTPVAQAVCVARWGMRLCSRGPVWLTDCDQIAALRSLRRAGVSLINGEIGDAGALRAAGFRPLLSGATMAELDLAEWREGIDSKWRARLRQSLDLTRHFTLRAAPFDPLKDRWLLRASARLAQERRFAAYPERFTGRLAANPGAARIWSLHNNRTPIAGIMVLHHGHSATYHLAWSGPEGRRCHAHRRLLALAADWLAARGVKRLDLGTIDTDNAPGLARFKLTMGARAVPLAGTWGAFPVWPRSRRAARDRIDPDG